jgi:hypothetical protein
MSAREQCLTFVEDVAHGAVINDHDLAQIGLHLCQILDVSPIAKRAVLPIVSACKVLALCFEPINDGIGILLHRGSKDDEIIPFANLDLMISARLRNAGRTAVPFLGTRRSAVACVHNTEWGLADQ